MIRIPLDPYNDRLPDGRTRDVVVDATEGSIDFSVALDPREIFTRGPDRNLAAKADEILEAFAGAPGRLTRADAEILILEIGHLRRRVVTIPPDLSVHPAPEEARAIAAALIHYAAETENGRA